MRRVIEMDQNQTGYLIGGWTVLFETLPLIRTMQLIYHNSSPMTAVLYLVGARNIRDEIGKIRVE